MPDPKTITAPAVDTAPSFAFPSAAMVDAAAAAFPRVEADGFGYGWSRTGPGQPFGVESRDAIEGVWPRLHVAPGMLRVSFLDHAKHLRTRDRARDLQQTERRLADAMGLGLDDFLDAGTPKRGIVQGWSRKSRAALVRKIATLDLQPVVSSLTPPAMVTLTLPGDWQSVCPDGEAAARLFDAWTRAYRRRWGVELQCIWKREFQRRGAPHWHLWMSLPTVDEGEFVRWLSASWAAVVAADASPEKGSEHRAGIENRHGVPLCSCSERCRHRAAGTGVDITEGRRARDPRRLAVYFLKESASLGAKAYQNRPPASWDGGTVGRYWGVRGLQSVEAVVPLDPAIAPALWRILRRLHERRRPAQPVPVTRVDPATGEVRRKRPVKRVERQTGRNRSGWVAFNDATSTAWVLARWPGLAGGSPAG